MKKMKKTNKKRQSNSNGRSGIENEGSRANAFLTNANSSNNEKLKSSKVKSTRLSKAASTGPSGVGGRADASVNPKSNMLLHRM